MAALTFAVVAGFGAAILWAAVRVLDWVDAPGWVVWLLWLAPTVGMTLWALGRPAAATLSDDDDDTWIGFSVRFVLIGLDAPRSRPVRALVALATGAPIAWAYAVFVLLALSGLV